MGRGTTVIDLEGRSALPGINDAHVHGLAAGLSLPPLLARRQLPGGHLDRGHRRARGAGGRGRRTGRVDPRERMEPRAARRDPRRPGPAADAAGPRRGVAGQPRRPARLLVPHRWVNTRALELAGITRDTVPPPGGVIDRDAAGEPIGLLRESAQQLVLAVLPPLPPDQLRGALSTAVGVLLSQGITSYTDPGLTPDEIDVYRDALANDALGARVTLMLTSSDSLLIGGTGGGSVEQFERMLARYPRPAGVRRAVAGAARRQDLRRRDPAQPHGLGLRALRRPGRHGRARARGRHRGRARRRAAGDRAPRPRGRLPGRHARHRRPDDRRRWSTPTSRRSAATAATATRATTRSTPT